MYYYNTLIERRDIDMNIAKIGINNSFANKKVTFTQNKSLISKLNLDKYNDEDSEEVQKVRQLINKAIIDLKSRNSYGFVQNYNKELEFLSDIEKFAIAGFKKRGY